MFLVQNTTTKEVFAMKVLKKFKMLQDNSLESTLVESYVLLKCDHPFMIKMRYMFLDEQRIYFLMQFVRGGDLINYMDPTEPFKEDVARFYAFQIALAFGHMHSKQVVHRDLKPENILLNEDGYISLTDFGIAKKIEGGEEAKTRVGTPDYMAPEILNDKGHSFPVDWWALGIFTYDMMMGAPPFSSISNQP